MLCIACVMCAYDVAVQFAIALLFMPKNDKMQQSKQTRITAGWFKRGLTFRIWLVYVL